VTVSTPPVSGITATFSAGMHAAFRGLRVASGSREVRGTYAKLVAAIFMVAAWIDVGGVWLVWHATATDPNAAWWVLVALWLLRIAGTVIVLLVAPILALLVVNTLFPFLAERVFFAAMRQVAPARAEELLARDGMSLARGAAINLTRMALLMAYAALSLAVSFVPAVGAVAGPALSLYFTARALVWELLDPYFDKLQLDFAAQRRFVAEHRSAMLGFGVPIGLLMAIPLAGPLLFGLSQAATAIFVTDVIEGGAASDAP
jgi:CysZ protein